jgi:chromosome segregation ATPase
MTSNTELQAAFYNGTAQGYKNGHLDGYQLAASEAHSVIFARDQKIALLEAMLRDKEPVRGEMQMERDIAQQDLEDAFDVSSYPNDEFMMRFTPYANVRNQLLEAKATEVDQMEAVEELKDSNADLRQQLEDSDTLVVQLKGECERFREANEKDAEQCVRLANKLDQARGDGSDPNDTMQNLRGYVTTLEDECQRAEVRADELKQLIDTRNIANNQLLNGLIAVRDWIGWPSAFQLNVEGFERTLVESGFSNDMLKSLKN